MILLICRWTMIFVVSLPFKLAGSISEILVHPKFKIMRLCKTDGLCQVEIRQS